MDINSAVGRKNGLSKDEIQAILSGDDGLFATPDRLLLHFADRLSSTPADVDDGLYSELQQHFSDEQLIAFAAAIAQENYRARFNRAFNVGSDSLYHPK